MPAYAGFKSLAHYLDERCERESLNHNSLSAALKVHRTYIHSVYHGLFQPSKKRCDLIARYFGDDPHLLRVLAGHEAPPINLDDRQLREIHDLALGLDSARLAKVIRFINDLTAS